jgi:hypothetical protein
MIPKLSENALQAYRRWCKSHSVTAYRYTTTAGAAGGLVRSATSLGPLDCRIVPISSRETSELRLLGYRIVAKVYFSQNPSLQTDDYLVYGTRTLFVRSIRCPDELSQMWIVEVEENKDVNDG